MSLTLQGIHSYREAVTIDFDELGRFGLFGIFGAIGSGKSTILDGLTLALYGAVDRITSRARRGLVNLGSARAEVRLTFRAQTATGPTLFEVHRAYRARDGVAERVASRLTRLGQPPVVLADKERDVNDAVAEIIGLGSEDFMRAVVLPQGRFQQLLHLKGSERRQMLQRIFRLHAYGEGLRSEVHRRHSEARRQLAEARGELQGLGDAGESVLEAARDHALATREERARAEHAHEALATRHRQALEQRAAHQRLTDARADLADHEATRPAQEARQAQLAAAREVAAVLEPARRWQGAHVDWQSAQSALTQHEGALATHEQALEQARLAAQAHDARVAAEEPELLERLTAAQAALELLAQRERVEQQLTTAHEAVSQADIDLDGAANALTHLQQQRQEALKERRTVRRQVAQRQVRTEERGRVQRATRAAHALEHAQQLTQEAREQGAALQLEASGAQAALDEAREASERTARGVAESVEQLQRAASDPGWLADERRAELDAAIRSAEQTAVLRAARQEELARELARREHAAQAAATARVALSEAETEARTAAEVLQGATAAVERAEAVWRTQQRRRSASEIARTLRMEEPCPVCGSEHHPAPADPEPPGEPYEAAAAAHTEGHRRAVERHESALGALGQARAVLQAAEAAAAGAHQAHEEAMAACAELPVSDPAPLREALAAHRAADQAKMEAEHRVRHAEAAAERAAAPLAVAEARVAQLGTALEQAQGQLERRQSTEGRAWAAFDEERGDLTLFDVANATTGLDARDREVEGLQGRVEQLDHTLGELDQQLSAAQERQSTSQASHTRAVERAAALQASLLDLTPAEALSDPAAVVAETTQAREALHAAVATHQEAIAASSKAHEAAARAYAGTQAAHRAATDTRARARQELDARAPTLVGQPEVDVATQVAQWSAQALSEATLGALEADIAAWREAYTALRARVTTLGEAADSTSLSSSEQAFADLEESVEGARATLEAAREASVAATRGLADLEEKAPRFEELTTSVAQTDAELGRLGVLSTVLRGDRFVEYVASDYLAELAERASEHLSALTHGRYRLQIDQDVSFLVEDAHGGGALRPVHTLSGGESFLTALSLALALSTQVQARSSRPLGFFFLDEGFGTLDPEALDRVMSAIEKLRSEDRVIGLISHVPSVRERVPRYLWVERPEAGHGTTVVMRDN